MNEPAYLTIARGYIGTRELTGKNDSPVLLNWWQRFKAAWLYGQPWCGLLVAVCMKEAGMPYPQAFYRAKSWLDYGRKLNSPCLGAIVIFDRKGGGHVGFIIGLDHANRLLVLGGNQGNKVSVMAFERSRVIGYRLPDGVDLQQLPIMSMNVALSESEA